MPLLLKGSNVQQDSGPHNVGFCHVDIATIKSAFGRILLKKSLYLEDP